MPERAHCCKSFADAVCHQSQSSAVSRQLPAVAACQVDRAAHGGHEKGVDLQPSVHVITGRCWQTRIAKCLRYLSETRRSPSINLADRRGLLLDHRVFDDVPFARSANAWETEYYPIATQSFSKAGRADGIVKHEEQRRNALVGRQLR